MRRASIVLFTAGLVAALMALMHRRGFAQQQQGQDSAEKEPLEKQRSEALQTFMEAKLEHSQEVLRGITTEDHKRIAKHGQVLGPLSLESNWNVLQTEEYVKQGTEFRRAADALSQAGRDADLGVATIAHLDLTVKCVNCHQYLRRRAEWEAPAEQGD